MEYFRIKNWDKYQPQKRSARGNFHYCLFDTAALDDPKTAEMSHSQFGIFARLLLWARRMDNKLPHDQRWLSARLTHKCAHRRANLQFLWDLGLLEMISTAGEERRGEESIQHISPSAPEPVGSSPLIGLWNQHTKASKARGESKKRAKASAQRWKEKPDRSYWIGVVQKINESPFCQGHSDRGWRANVDWFLRPDTHLKVMEGFYDSKASEKVIKWNS